ncbi:MAG: RloB family protein [Saprospiraceae bacterium]
MRHKRRTNKRKRSVKPRLLILCEGETERNYFEAMKEDDDYESKMAAAKITILTAKSPTPEQIIKEAIKKGNEAKREKNPYEMIWVVFDHDNHPHRKEAYDNAIKDKLEIKVAFSAICFETWYLLHFEKSAKSYSNASKLIITLKKHYPNYQKAKQNDFVNLKPNLQKAIENAKWLRKRMNDEEMHITDYNPWTDVDLLIKDLNNL